MGGRVAHPRPTGQHFLVPRLAADLVRNSGVTRGDLVLEIGAGTGVLTRELARHAGEVIAIELDPALARRLRGRPWPNVRVVCADAAEVVLPSRPFRVVGNLPFAATTALLRHLFDDPRRGPLRADLIVQWGVAVKRCSQRPSTLLTMSWAPWFELTISRRLRASSFRPRPTVDAAVMTVTRRPDPLLELEDHEAYVRFLRRMYRRTPSASHLDVWEWTQRFRGGTT